MASPYVSVIIPCYNQGKYIDDAVNSVLNQTYQDFEIIIVNDGSQDQETINILNDYNKSKTRVIHVVNQGVALARNFGIKESKGKYILPLDADDKINCTYLEKAVNILEQNTSIGIVYCEAEYFGTKTGKWDLPEYNFPGILSSNCIFCSAFYRKSDWEKTTGYNSNMIHGWEDYDFWLSLIELGVEVYRIPEILFLYRQKTSSRDTDMTYVQKIYSFIKLFENHPGLYADYMQTYDQLISHYKELTAVNV